MVDFDTLRLQSEASKGLFSGPAAAEIYANSDLVTSRSKDTFTSLRPVSSKLNHNFL